MKWFPDWSKEIVAVVASGPSASTVGVEQLKGKARVIAVNASWKLVPWADVLYATDFMFWYQNKGVPEFKGMKVCCGKGADREFKGLRAVSVPPPSEKHLRCSILMEPRGVIGSGGNSGFQALNLAAQFGARRILMVGFDMTLAHGKHWHKDHEGKCKNPVPDLTEKWRKNLDAQAHTFVELGIDVVNTSPISALTEYRRATIEEALCSWSNESAGFGGLSAASRRV